MRADNTIRLLTSHGAVLLMLAQDGQCTLATLASCAGLTQRQVARVLRELEEAGYVRPTREGNRRHYHVVADRPLARPSLPGITAPVLATLGEALMAAKGTGDGRSSPLARI